MRGLRRRHPVIRLAVDTMPSFAPNTAARSQVAAENPVMLFCRHGLLIDP